MCTCLYKSLPIVYCRIFGLGRFIFVTKYEIFMFLISFRFVVCLKRSLSILQITFCVLFLGLDPQLFLFHVDR